MGSSEPRRPRAPHFEAPRAHIILVGVCAFALGGIAACATEGVVGSFEKPNVNSETNTSTAQDGGADADAPVIPVASSPLAAGGASTCVKTSASKVTCWGENGTGSLGLGRPGIDVETSAKPVTPTVLGEVRFVAAGERAQCAFAVDDNLYCWGETFIGVFNGRPIEPLPMIVPSTDGTTNIKNLANVAVGRHFMCGLTTEGVVRCSGLNSHGEVGVGHARPVYLPTTLEGLDGPATSIAASMGGQFVCATTSAGSVFCWGHNTDGQIGPERGDVLAPRKIEGLRGRATSIAAGAAHVCAILDTNEVACWGAGKDGQLGDGKKTSSTTPVTVLYLTDIKSLAAGFGHTCALRTDGGVFCWGRNDQGQAGMAREFEGPFVVIVAHPDVEHIACGLVHTCAWSRGGDVECWGSNTDSQLGPRRAVF